MAAEGQQTNPKSAILEGGAMIRAPMGGPGRGDWRLTESTSDLDDGFGARCLELWDRGLDTKEIADITFQWEYVVERTLRLARERRRMEK
jgi:hypothetical protein